MRFGVYLFPFIDIKILIVSFSTFWAQSYLFKLITDIIHGQFLTFCSCSSPFQFIVRQEMNMIFKISKSKLIRFSLISVKCRADQIKRGSRVTSNMESAYKLC